MKVFSNIEWRSEMQRGALYSMLYQGLPIIARRVRKGAGGRRDKATARKIQITGPYCLYAR